MSTSDIIYNGLGILGAILLLFGFYRVNSGKWTNKSLWYELDNIIGAAMLMIYQIHYHAYVTVVVNAIWGLIAVWGVIVFFRRVYKHKHRRGK